MALVKAPVIVAQIFIDSDIRYIATRTGHFTINSVDNFYEGILETPPSITESLQDLYWGVERSSSVTINILDRDQTWLNIIQSEEVRGRWVGLFYYEENDGDWLEFRGKITQWKYSKGRLSLTLQMRDDTTLDTTLPRKVVNTDDFPNAPDTDIGQPIALPFGYCRNVPLRHVLNDTTNNYYDYVIAYVGTDIIEGIWDDGSTLGVKRNGIYVNPAEYTFYDGSQSSPYPGFAFIRFTKEQRDFSNNFYKLTADIKGLKLGGTSANRNYADIIKAILSDSNIGIGDNADTTSFSDAASSLDTLGGMYCDYAIAKQVKARDVIDLLLQVCRGHLVRGADGEWEITVDTAYDSSIWGYFGWQDDQYSGILDVTEISIDSASQTLGSIDVDYYIIENDLSKEPKNGPQRRKSYQIISFGTPRQYKLPCVMENSTADKFINYLRGRTLYSSQRLRLSLGLEATGLTKGKVIFINIPYYNISGTYRVEKITRSLGKFDVVVHSYDSNIYSEVTIADPVDPQAQTNTVDGVLWDGVVGTGKPEDNATLGATWGSNIDGQPDDALLLNELNGIGGYQGVPLPKENGQPVPIDVYVNNDSVSPLWFKVFEVDLTSYNYGSCTWNGIFSKGNSNGRFITQMRVRLSIHTGGTANITNTYYRYSGDNLTGYLKLLYDGNVCQVWVYLNSYNSCLFNGAWSASCGVGKSWIKTSQGASDGTTTAPIGTFVTPEYNYELGATVGAPDSTPLGGMTVQDSVAGDGVFFTTNGIEGWKSGSRTFLLDAVTGDATFSGTLAGARVETSTLTVDGAVGITMESGSDMRFEATWDPGTGITEYSSLVFAIDLNDGNGMIDHAIIQMNASAFVIDGIDNTWEIDIAAWKYIALVAEYDIFLDAVATHLRTSTSEFFVDGDGAHVDSKLYLVTDNASPTADSGSVVLFATDDGTTQYLKIMWRDGATTTLASHTY